MGLVGYRAMLLDYVDDPAASLSAMRLEPDGLLVVAGGKVEARGPFAEVRPRYPDVALVEFPGKVLIPGLIDSHIHYPQTEMLAAYGEQLLEWLQTYTFPTELAFQDPAHAHAIAEVFVQELLRNGTTTALVLCSVHPQSVDALGEVAERYNMRLIFGKVLMDRNAPEALCDTPERAYGESKALIQRWHERGRALYAVTPRFAATSSPEQLQAAGTLKREFPSVYVHTHLAENRSEVAWVRTLFPERNSYTDVYAHYGLLSDRSVFAHGIYLEPPELELLARHGSSIAFCPTSNLFLGSGLFSYERVRAAGVQVSIATDVGAGTSFSLLRTLSEAYKVLQLQGQRLSVHQGLYLATLGTARALGLDALIGNFEPRKEADFVVLDFASTPLLALRAQRARDFDDQLFSLMMLGDDRAVFATYVSGTLAHSRDVAAFSQQPRS